MALVVLFVVGMALMSYRRRPSENRNGNGTSTFRFENPIYRRTAEDLDTDTVGVPDMSLGVVHLQPSDLASQPSSSLA